MNDRPVCCHEVFKVNGERKLLLEVTSLILVALQMVDAKQLPTIDSKSTDPIAFFIIYRHEIVVVIFVSETKVGHYAFSCIPNRYFSQAKYISTQSTCLYLAFFSIKCMGICVSKMEEDNFYARSKIDMLEQLPCLFEIVHHIVTITLYGGNISVVIFIDIQAFSAILRRNDNFARAILYTRLSVFLKRNVLRCFDYRFVLYFSLIICFNASVSSTCTEEDSPDSCWIPLHVFNIRAPTNNTKTAQIPNMNSFFPLLGFSFCPLPLESCDEA